MSAPSTIDDETLEFVNNIQLVEIDVLKMSIDLDIEADEYTPSTDEIEPEFGIAIDSHDELQRARFRVRVDISFPRTAQLTVEMGAVYDLGTTSLDDLDPDVITNFFNKIVMMTVYPYIRAEVSYLTSRTFGNPLTLPILKHGDVVFGE